jgi:ribosome-associated heat shock protein Hsp15
VQSAKVRLDKWLWAARFFKTRGLAKAAIEGGKVHYDGQRSKCSRIVELNAELTIRQGWDDKTIQVVALSEQRRGAPEAAKLYKETAASEAKRTEQAAARKAMGGGISDHRPSKKERRDQSRFLNNQDD